ncbi:hypothetical protein BDD30_2639 [Photorhabdus asymbiotica]|uniref:Uncharacterized protein n=1 Tax=Photorhabdus asymbiotica TaxID=291112 RepID=A0ABX9SLE4_9GAMM|nr:hypothetical protein BDD30_2639 [Photorhabdus asymbiotica]
MLIKIIYKEGEKKYKKIYEYCLTINNNYIIFVLFLNSALFN